MTPRKADRHRERERERERESERQREKERERESETDRQLERHLPLISTNPYSSPKSVANRILPVFFMMFASVRRQQVRLVSAEAERPNHPSRGGR